MIEKVLVVVTLWLSTTAVVQSERATCQTAGKQMTCSGRDSLKHILIRNRDYTDVDTLIVHGDKIDLTEDVIPEGVNFSHVTLLNATGNEISRIGRRGFNNTRDIQYLYLSNNKISQSQPDPFQALEKLTVLEMNDALDGNSDDKYQLLRNIFKSKNEFVLLREIELNKNGLTNVHSKTFCQVEGLIRLGLSNNRLESFDFARECFHRLKALFVAGNLIEKIPTDIWDFLPSISTLDISNNPIHCDCNAVKLSREDNVDFVNQAQTKCASPPEVEGKVLFDLPKDYCTDSKKSSIDSRGKTSFFQFFVLFVIAIGILWLYKKYRERMNYMSSTPVGYHNLQHEQAVEPEFV